MSGPRGIVLDGGERLREAVAALPEGEREAAARRLGLDQNRTRRAAYRDWLGVMPTTMARVLRLLPWGAGDRRLYLGKADSDGGGGAHAQGEGR